MVSKGLKFGPDRNNMDTTDQFASLGLQRWNGTYTCENSLMAHRISGIRKRKGSLENPGNLKNAWQR